MLEVSVYIANAISLACAVAIIGRTLFNGGRL